jgi:hypothetical protein
MSFSAGISLLIADKPQEKLPELLAEFSYET